MEEEILSVPVENPDAPIEVVDIQFRPGQKVYYFDPAGLTCRPEDHLIIETARGPEYGICVGGNHTIRQQDVVMPLRSVMRFATEADERLMVENRAKEQKAYEICLQKIEEHQLDMQLVSAEYAFDGSKILFFFTADERVDFRELVKNLAGVFHTRIELRQIGVRDKAKMVGGLGICGRPFCCASFLDDFQPVSIKMAKTQNLSLNPTKISGTCGRLMCCLKYEQDAYEDLIRRSPKLDSLVDTPDGRGTVVELDLLRQRVKVRLDSQPEGMSVYSNDSIAILRNGKAKKNDEPIPDDLAPISGGNKLAREAREEESAGLDPIRFRYSTETITEESAPAEENGDTVTEQQENTGERHQRHRRRNRGGKKPAQPADGSEQVQAQPQEKPQEATEENGEEPAAKKKPHRRNNYRRYRKPRGNGENSQAET